MVTVRNASSAKVASISVGFATQWFMRPGMGTNTGRNVTLKRTFGFVSGTTNTQLYEVCLPEHNTPFVYAEPVSTSWVWARG
jgi:hypothetical protein